MSAVRWADVEWGREMHNPSAYSELPSRARGSPPLPGRKHLAFKHNKQIPADARARRLLLLKTVLAHKLLPY
jgi:hypothetical protein